jgi:hypothetical protein
MRLPTVRRKEPAQFSGSIDARVSAYRGCRAAHLLSALVRVNISKSPFFTSYILQSSFVDSTQNQ